ncbi:hypothetical protein BaRGS_00008948 [Batillaria attramentaria]|uniref:HMG box domain-containing protein n=1 Tax=Batillaria attramentaria TaxID=370345 RepID=A0ABD0LLJ7_9CAEN
MPSKNTMNGFAVFMYEIKERRRLNMSGQQLATFCSPLWANLSAGEKKQYDMRAKEMKAQKKATDGDMARRDNVGNIIGTRKNPEEERRKRRQTDQELVTRDWPGKDLMDEKFYFVNFQDMCELSEPDNNTDREWLPREVAIVEYTMRRGIIRIYHAFIDPGPIPKGFRFTCMQKSDAEHKIPIEDFELASNNYPLIWRKMKELLRDGMKDGQDADYEKIKYLMDWMWCRSDDGDLSDNPAGHVCALEDLVVNLLAYSNQPNTETISNASVVSRLDGSHWDYISNTSCEWHEDQETKYCALGIVRRYAFTISDILSQVYPINLTERHVPIRSSTEEVARVLPPESMPTVSNQQRMRGKTRAKEKPGSAGDMRRVSG